ncbi:MAG TPA: flagellar hook-length control protein FliK [Candidatus Binatia bacterium]
MSAAPPRVDAPAPSEPASGDTPTFATALDAAHGEIASREAPARRVEDRPSDGAHDDDGREGPAHRDAGSKATSSSPETGPERATHVPTRHHKASTAGAAHASDGHVTHAVKPDAAPGTAAPKTTDAPKATDAAATQTPDAAAKAAAATVAAVSGAEAPVDGKTPISHAVQGAPDAGVVAAAAGVRGTAGAEPGTAVQPTLAAAAKKVEGKMIAASNDADASTTSATRDGKKSDKAARPADVRNAHAQDVHEQDAHEPAAEAKPSAGAIGQPRHSAHDETPADGTSEGNAKAPDEQHAVSVPPSAAASADEPARAAVADEPTVRETASRAASTEAPVVRPAPSPQKIDATPTKARSASTATDGEAVATPRANGQGATTAVAPAERQGGGRPDVDVANGKRAAIHRHPGSSTDDAADGDASPTAVTEGHGGTSQGGPSAARGADAKIAAERAFGTAPTTNRPTAQDATATAEPGPAAGGAHGAGEQAATAAATSAETRGGTSAPAPADVAHTVAAPRGDTTVAAAWAERVVESVRVATLRGGGEMRLRLEPAGLGNIDVRISLGHDGVRASIVAEHDTTRALLRNEQHLLHAALERSDLRLAGFSVDLGSGGSGNAFADVEHQGRWSGEAGGERAVDVPPEIVAMDAPAAPGRLSVRV